MDSTEIAEETQAKFQKVNLNMEVAMLEQIRQSGDKITDFVQKACVARLVALGLRQPDIQSGPYHADPRVDALVAECKAIAAFVAKLESTVQRLQDDAEDNAAHIAVLLAGLAGPEGEGDGDER